MTTTPDINTTRDGILVRAGQIWEDCDKRMHGRRIRVRFVEDGKAVVEPIGGGRRTVLAVRRMHKHSTGFRLLQEAPNA